MIAWMRKISPRTQILGRAIGRLLFLSILIVPLCSCVQHGLLSPKGIITYEERKLFFDTLALMLIVVLPVIIMSFTFVYHYQVSHRIRTYKPNWSHNILLESLWWGIPIVIIFVLAVLTWKKTHQLDPYNKIAGVSGPPLLIQAIALPWKWLFIYPENNIATVNYLMIPIDRQVEFWMTTDNVPMSAMFIPQIGSQIYAMAGMRSRMHLVATHLGVYEGMNAQYNGAGFSDMRFPVHVVNLRDMQQWINQIKASPMHLTNEMYIQLLKPSIGDKPKFFSDVTPNLFHNVMMTYMHSIGNVHPRQNQASFTTLSK